MDQNENIIEINLEEKIKEQKQQKKQNNQKRRDFRRDFQRPHYQNNRNNSWGNERSHHQKQNSNAIVDIDSLHYSVTNDELKELAEQYGKVKWCKVEWDKMGRSKECASIEYFNSGDARRAAEQLSNVSIESQPMKAHVRDNVNRRNFFKRS